MIIGLKEYEMNIMKTGIVVLNYNDAIETVKFVMILIVMIL